MITGGINKLGFEYSKISGNASEPHFGSGEVQESSIAESSPVCSFVLRGKISGNASEPHFGSGEVRGIWE